MSYRWPYGHVLHDQHGAVLIETGHGSTGSLAAEVLASASRIAGGKPNRAGQIPARLTVIGVEEAVWHGWLTANGYQVP